MDSSAVSNPQSAIMDLEPYTSWLEHTRMRARERNIDSVAIEFAEIVCHHKALEQCRMETSQEVFDFVHERFLWLELIKPITGEPFPGVDPRLRISTQQYRDAILCERYYLVGREIWELGRDVYIGGALVLTRVMAHRLSWLAKELEDVYQDSLPEYQGSLPGFRISGWERGPHFPSLGIV